MQTQQFCRIGNDFHYTVTGRWPFPTDMLRHDLASAATPEDQALIDALSGEYLPDSWNPRERVFINLVVLECGHWRPNTARWESYGWSVPQDAEHKYIAAERERLKAHGELRRSALAKLTPEEATALGFGKD